VETSEREDARERERRTRTHIATHHTGTRRMCTEGHRGDLTTSPRRTSTTASRPRSVFGSSDHGVDGALKCRRTCITRSSECTAGRQLGGLDGAQPICTPIPERYGPHAGARGEGAMPGALTRRDIAPKRAPGKAWLCVCSTNSSMSRCRAARKPAAAWAGWARRSDRAPQNSPAVRLYQTPGAGAGPFFRYLSAWFCPFAHRATIALEHHAGRVGYEWVEALGWTRKETKDGERADEWYYHWKSDELLKHNPSALVPTLIDARGRSVYESLVCVDFIDAVSGATGQDRLVSSDPVEAARSRVWAEKLNRECCSPYYGVLVKTDKGEQKAAFNSLLQGLRNFSKELVKTPGPTFLADAQLSNADISLLPWAYRYYVFEHYRGPEFVIPEEKEDASLAAYHEWFRHVMALPQV